MIRLGTRDSALALAQARWVRSVLEKNRIESEICPMKSLGDENTKDPLYAMEGAEPGVFTKVLERALLKGEVDWAVHSLKDMPTVLDSAFVLGAVAAREDAADVWVCREDNPWEGSLDKLPKNARVGTSSLRREALLYSFEKSLNVVSLRGNVATRLKAVLQGKVDGAILAQAGIDRLKRSEGEGFLEGLRVVRLDPERFVSAPGQGALGIEVLAAEEKKFGEALALLKDAHAFRETQLERRLLRKLEGGCTLPFGARVWSLPEGKLRLVAFLGGFDLKDGKRNWTSFERFDTSDTNDEALFQKAVQCFKSS